MKSNGRLVTGFRKINELLNIKEASYRVYQNEAKKDGNRYKTAWRIIQMLKWLVKNVVTDIKYGHQF
ncbi:hypothetical protein [Sporosarcina sp. FA15]|uniref:hypothetical protein n=1 Tax=Sporosarcina sp. FA15 TaxID=3413031 RepID=UPI003F65EC9F